ncbi:NfeD family protein [Rothia sp. P7208]|uniref:NfeD family protein n=1 Tax=Rothia sp. P7208 TaxID=3402660 RepID=UPI003ABE7239
MFDWFANHLWAFWILAAILLAIIEILSLDFFFLMLSLAALGTSASTLFTESLNIQVFIFAVLSIVLLLAARPKLIRRLNKNTPNIATNTAGLIGQEVKILEQVTSHSGLVELAGDTWTARSVDKNKSFSPSQNAYVLKIKGATAYIGEHNS